VKAIYNLLTGLLLLFLCPGSGSRLVESGAVLPGLPARQYPDVVAGRIWVPPMLPWRAGLSRRDLDGCLAYRVTCPHCLRVDVIGPVMDLEIDTHPHKINEVPHLVTPLSEGQHEQRWARTRTDVVAFCTFWCIELAMSAVFGPSAPFGFDLLLSSV